MVKSDFIDAIVREKKHVDPPGIFSICSANPYVLRACMRKAGRSGQPLLIESTCNQVNQYGGYMNLKPAQFIAYVRTLADEIHFPFDNIFFGGDHLGPSAWRDEPVETAMRKSVELVHGYVRAGYKKIHLDASMPCGDDPTPLPKAVIAKREAQLCQAAVEEIRILGKEICDLTFVVGSEVPTPGGSYTDENAITISGVDETEENIADIRKAFIEYHLEDAWERIKAFVVQPGVEFSDTHVHAFQPEKAKALSVLIEQYENLVYEAHSTDYQNRLNLKQMVANHFAILKVGPALTFALREALFSLEAIEEELLHGDAVLLSNFRNVLDEAMQANPKFWKQYYSQDARTQYLQRKYSLLDRSRYYFNSPEVEEAIQRLIANLARREIPHSLIRQYFPDLSEEVEQGLSESHPNGLINGRIGRVLEDYEFACGQPARRIPDENIRESILS